MEFFPHHGFARRTLRFLGRRSSDLCSDSRPLNPRPVRIADQSLAGVPRRRVRVAAPSIEGTIAVVVALLLALAAARKLTQSDGDLFGHIAFGREVLRASAVPRSSLLGFADTSVPSVSPAWGAATLFALLYRTGGLALIAALIACVAGVTHGVGALYLKRRAVDPVLIVGASMLGFLLAASHWLARPHALSIFASAVLLLLLERGKRSALFAIPVLFAFWCNVHGGWAFGLIVLGAYTVGATFDGILQMPACRTEIVQLWGVLTLSVAATLLNPFGYSLHIAVLQTLTDASVAGVINEYQPPSLSNPIDVVFFLLLAVSIVGIIASRRRLPTAHGLVIALCSVFALRAGRNISLFGVVAWPLLVVNLSPLIAPYLERLSFHRAVAEFAGRSSRSRLAAVVMFFVVCVGLNRGEVAGVTVIDGRVDGERFPSHAVAELRTHALDRPLLTTWTWSGYVPFAWDQKRTYFDPLFFSPATLRAFGTMLLAKDGWRAELQEHRVDMVMLPPSVPLRDSLRADAGWHVSIEDSTATVFERIAPSAPRP